MNPPLHVANWVAEKYTRIIDAVWGGEHHLKNSKWHRADLQVWLHGTLSTFDFSEMTRLVVVCHDECVRAEVRGASGGLSVWLSVREEHPEAPHGATRGHPKLERHIEVIREMLAVGNNGPMNKLYRELEATETPCPTEPTAATSET